ncbi:MAG: hypothetical protein ACR2GR_05315 [Rhodothermales bacterium]
MKHPFLPALLGALFLLTCAACEDPSNVGVGLVGEGGEPVLERVDATRLDTTAKRDVTGNTQRLLAGTVADPLLGTITAEGFLDLLNVSGEDLPGFRDTLLTSATLRLVPDYVYGDTTREVTLTLFGMPEEFNATSAFADTTLLAGEAITTFSFLPTDSLVTVSLPETWLAENDTTLRSTSVADVLHGFKLAAAPGSGNAVVGFDRSETVLEAIAGADTVFFGQSSGTASGFKSLTTLSREGEPTLLPDRTVLQDGVGPGVRLDLDLTDSDFLGEALNRAEIVVYADLLALQQNAPAGFARPTIEPVELIGVDADGNVPSLSDGSPILSIFAEPDEEGRLRFSSNVLRVLIQEVLLERDNDIDHFELRAPPALTSISPLFLYPVGSGETTPQVQLTIANADS